MKLLKKLLMISLIVAAIPQGLNASFSKPSSLLFAAGTALSISALSLYTCTKYVIIPLKDKQHYLGWIAHRECDEVKTIMEKIQKIRDAQDKATPANKKLIQDLSSKVRGLTADPKLFKIKLENPYSRIEGLTGNTKKLKENLNEIELTIEDIEKCTQIIQKKSHGCSSIAECQNCSAALNIVERGPHKINLFLESCKDECQKYIALKSGERRKIKNDYSKFFGLMNKGNRWTKRLLGLGLGLGFAGGISKYFSR